MIIIRTLRKDIANYNKEDDIVRGLGWGGMDLQREGGLAAELQAPQTRTGGWGEGCVIIHSTDLESIEKENKTFNDSK